MQSKSVIARRLRRRGNPFSLQCAAGGVGTPWYYLIFGNTENFSQPRPFACANLTIFSFCPQIVVDKGGLQSYNPVIL